MQTTHDNLCIHFKSAFLQLIKPMMMLQPLAIRNYEILPRIAQRATGLTSPRSQNEFPFELKQNGKMELLSLVDCGKPVPLPETKVT